MVQAAKICGVSIATWRRWEKGTSEMPVAAWQWFLTVTNGLPLSREWEGWCFHEGKLWSPERASFTAGQIRSLQILQQASRTRTMVHAFKPCDLVDVDERLGNHLKFLGKLDLIGMLLAITYTDHLTHDEAEQGAQLEDGLRKLIAGVQNVQRGRQLAEVKP